MGSTTSPSPTRSILVFADAKHAPASATRLAASSSAAAVRRNRLFGHRGGTVVAIVALSIAGWAVIIGLAHLLWRMF